jgi:DNA replication protein DnaD
MDYKEQIQERHEELCFEFEEENGRTPTQAESLDLWRDAEEYISNRQAEYGDWLRKRAMGE